jgi:large subunit ribosomal protein L7/L12
MAAKKLSTEDNKYNAKSASGGKETKLSKGVEKLVDEISKLSVMELSELVNALQDKLGITAATPMAAAPVAAQGAGGETPTAGSTQGGGAANQTVVMTAAGANKINVIKAIREIDQNIGLKEAKDMTENLPAEILKDAKADAAKEAAEKLKTAGATVELK